MKETAGGFAYQMSPKIPYAYEEAGMIVNFTLGNDIKILVDGIYYEGTMTDNFIADTTPKYNEYLSAFGGDAGELENYLPDITDDMSLIIYVLNYITV